VTGQQGLQPCCCVHHQQLRIRFVYMHTQFNPQEMVLILWAFNKVQRGGNIMFGTVARELMRQTNTGVMGVVGGGGGILGGMDK
jgi:hypothetical protein